MGRKPGADAHLSIEVEVDTGLDRMDRGADVDTAANASISAMDTPGTDPDARTAKQPYHLG